MTTVMYQGLQSCLESKLVESRTLMLKLASLKPNFSQPIELAFKSSSSPSSFSDSSNPKELKEECHSDKTITTTTTITSSSSNPKTGGRSFFQSLSSVTYNPKQTIEKENTYVHPIVKGSSMSYLRNISLELCTESLGSETGAYNTADNSIFSFSSWENEGGKYQAKEYQKPKPPKVLASEKMSARNFPPPLTTMRGSESLQFHPRREDGRLVIEAVISPLRKTLFQVERGNGRLRLSFLNHDFDSELFKNRKSNEGKCENDGGEEENEEENDVLLSEDDSDDVTIDDEGKTGIENYARMHFRCKEDGHGNNEALLLSNLEPFLVATS